MENMGKIYQAGHGGWNYKKLYKSLEKSAKAGNAKVYTNLGFCYRGGFGPKKADYNAAVNWFMKSVDAGQGSGMYYMGWMTYNGFGTPQDYNTAVEWYKKSANAGYADAAHKLGQLYMESPAVKQDFVEAYKWLLLAEKNGGNVFEDKYFVEKKLTAAQIEEAKAAVK
jgi:TPR repeat protein